MGNSKRIIISTILAGLTAVTIAASATRRGSSVLHYMTRTPLVVTDYGSNATASLRLQSNEQGHSSLQKFNLNASGLPANSEYFVVAAFDDHTNVAGPVNADANGSLRLAYTQKGQGRGNVKRALPGAFSPVTGIRSVALQNADTQTVALASIDASSDLQYLVKRNLTQEDTNASPSGSISLRANASTVNFRLVAGGLSAMAPYYLALNSQILAAETSDEGGALEINTWPSGAPAILDLRSLSLLDGASNVVLSTKLPK